MKCSGVISLIDVFFTHNVECTFLDTILCLIYLYTDATFYRFSLCSVLSAAIESQGTENMQKKYLKNVAVQILELI